MYANLPKSIANIASAEFRGFFISYYYRRSNIHYKPIFFKIAHRVNSQL